LRFTLIFRFSCGPLSIFLAGKRNTSGERYTSGRRDLSRTSSRSNATRNVTSTSNVTVIKGRIGLERRVEINFDLNYIFKLQSLQTVRPFFKICFRKFSRKSCRQFRSYQSGVIVVEGFGFVTQKVPPHRVDVWRAERR
jgi:hypothetical protein